MQINNLKRKHPNKKSTQVGRGGKRGKTSGRGTKGQKARAGRKIRPEFRDFIKKLPKMRGRGKNMFKSFKIKPLVVNLEVLEKHFSDGEKVSPQELARKKVLSGGKDSKFSVKILGEGTITKKLSVVNCAVSVSAKEKIEAAGGTVSL
ncbi:MAG: 50S ribosomal protein L15 [bacterium]|nr:50S ribosomal protein L15 [bacterium]